MDIEIFQKQNLPDLYTMDECELCYPIAKLCTITDFFDLLAVPKDKQDAQWAKKINYLIETNEHLRMFFEQKTAD